MILRLVVVVFTCFYCTVVTAQERITGTITLRDVISATLVSNPELDSFPLREESLLGQRETADLKPPLNFNAGVENAIGTGDLSGFSEAETTLSLSHVIEMGDKRPARIGVVNRRLELLETEKKVAELDLLTSATVRFIEVAVAQERVSLQQQARDIAEQTVALLEPLVTAGQAPQLELLRANAALSRAETALRFSITSLDSVRVKLSSMWGSQNPLFERVDANLFSVGEPGNLAALLLALESNPEIELFASEQRLREAQLQEAKAQSQSNIQWTAGIRHLKEINDTGLIFSISVPLFSKERVSGAVRSAQANITEVETRRITAINKMRGQLYALNQQLDQAIFEINTLQEEVIPLLRNVLTQTEEAFESGRYSYVELISAQREYLDAELSLINSTANAHILRAEIERLSGEPLPVR